ncbi:hypothetical protein KEM09_13810 [Carboxylicivirga mesophila]|uniref:DUF5675 domain-containing protein n=1 Tax=Carboxylicivirga mesophila TaxID=1166478 RepID=A0ABS5KC80_9BACT|nr:DUF5675 family protein [Carboxylicivirga mesophila]MBS2212487.1 hypothetical protein [Carboxylicivirga mesophila]
MKLTVVRYASSTDSTLGMLLIDGVFECYTLEDEHRDVKKMHETRIDAGTYKLQLRTHGRHHTDYLQKYGADWHYGMLQVMNVPKFTDILIHIGNTDDDTSGCLLVGDEVNNNAIQSGKVKNSTQAYVRMYPKIANALISGEEVTITYLDNIPISKNLTSGSPTVIPHIEQGQPKVVNTTKLNFREVPKGPLLGVLNENTQVIVKQTKMGWSKVMVEGWLSDRFLR